MTDGVTRSTRLTALVLFVAAPLALAGIAATSFLGYSESIAVAERQEALLAQLDARLARLGSGPAGLGDTSAIYLAGPSSPLAGAALQARLVTAAELVEGRVIETQTVEETEPDAEEDVRIRITLDVTTAGLRALLLDIEAGLPLLTVDRLAVRQLPLRDTDDPDDPLLRADLTVRGFYRSAS